MVRRRLLFSFFATASVVALLGTLMIKQPEQKRENILEWRKAIVLLNYHSLNECSGFFVSDDGIIATTFHLIKGWHIFVDHYKIIAVTYDKKTYHAKIEAFSIQKDILFLKIDYKPEFYFSKFAIGKKYEDCVIMGYPKGWSGYEQAKLLSHFKYDALGVSETPIQGESGSVVLRADGSVLGMVKSIYGKGILIPAISIRNGLKMLKGERE